MQLMVVSRSDKISSASYNIYKLEAIADEGQSLLIDAVVPEVYPTHFTTVKNIKT